MLHDIFARIASPSLSQLSTPSLPPTLNRFKVTTIATSSIMQFVESALDLPSMLKQGVTWTILYFVLAKFLHDNPSSGFSPKSHDGKTSRTAHRHAAYKLLLIPLIELQFIYLSVRYFEGWGNAFEFFQRFLTDKDFAQKEWLTPLPVLAVDMGNTFAVAFFLGFFHYLTLDPMKADRVWHKVFATTVSCLGVIVNLGGRMALFLVLLWKPAGLIESIFTLMCLSKIHRTPAGMAYVAVVTVINAFFRLVIEPLYLLGCLQAMLPTIFEYPSHMLMALCVAILTFLHMHWAIVAAMSLYKFYTDKSKLGEKLTT